MLAAWIDGRTVRAAIPNAAEWPEPTPRRATLGGRRDLAQHFMISAGIAVTGDSPLARAIGLVKEIDDSRGGSGFSFRDLAADNAGTRFGEVATASYASARRLQAAVGEGVSEIELAPAPADLAEGLSEAEFERRFGGTGSPEYARVVRAIEARIDASPLYAAR